MTIRAERAGDEEGIATLITRAFETAAHAGGNEAAIVDRLRGDGDLGLSLVAELGGAVIGHVAFSPVTIDRRRCGWYELAPLSVALEQRRQGIGAMLVRRGLELLREGGAEGVGVVGNPAYDERFGFGVIAGLAPAGPEAAFFRALAFEAPAPVGTVRYAAAFG